MSSAKGPNLLFLILTRNPNLQGLNVLFQSRHLFRKKARQRSLCKIVYQSKLGKEEKWYFPYLYNSNSEWILLCKWFKWPHIQAFESGCQSESIWQCKCSDVTQGQTLYRYVVLEPVHSREQNTAHSHLFELWTCTMLLLKLLLSFLSVIFCHSGDDAAPHARSPGDVIIGGLFPIHLKTNRSEIPENVICSE